jgi:DNA-binding MarR family transcriptional regulator
MTLSMQVENNTTDVEALRQTILRLSWASQRRLAHELDAFGLTVPQYMALRALNINPDGCSMSELAAASLQVSATMTGIIDRLVERGLAARQRDPEDRRALCISLTSQGHELLQQIERQQQARMQRIFGELTPEERQVLLRLISMYLEATLRERGSDGESKEAQDINLSTSCIGNSQQ